METLWTTEQTARVLGMKAHTLEKWRTTGAGPPFIYVGGAVRYRPSAVEAWLES
ncbi:MAG: helix-turn-helix domain-containing protein, partial [Nitrospinaceae bacterium]|nr:helix-turn-helix domain-containing protein [Nitrospinaceae bacterium]